MPEENSHHRRHNLNARINEMLREREGLVQLVGLSNMQRQLFASLQENITRLNHPSQNEDTNLVIQSILGNIPQLQTYIGLLAQLRPMGRSDHLSSSMNGLGSDGMPGPVSEVGMLQQTLLMQLIDNAMDNLELHIDQLSAQVMHPSRVAARSAEEQTIMAQLGQINGLPILISESPTNPMRFFVYFDRKFM